MLGMTAMDEPSASGPNPQAALSPLALRSRPALAGTPRALALAAARRTALALARREPAPLLALGFGAGLLARAALDALAAGRSEGSAAAPAEPELVAVRVEAVRIRVTHFLRRA
jgi:hypothetical protein